LQAALVDARDRLRAEGIVHPVLAGRGIKDQVDLRLACTGDRAARARVVATLTEVSAGAHRLMLSGETLYHHNPRPLLSLLADAGWGNARVRAVAIVRDTPSWLNSRYAFDASLFRIRTRFRPYVLQSLLTGEATRLGALQRWLRAPGLTMTVVPFRDRRDPRSVVVRAVDALELPSALLPSARQETHNVAPDPRTVEAARRLAAGGYFQPKFRSWRRYDFG